MAALQEPKMTWNYRTIEYRYLDGEDDLVVHEVYYLENNAPSFFTEDPVYPCSKEEAERILAAYELPPVAYINMKSIDGEGDEWGWLIQ
jgi:UDP-galactopyranose mutase